jgi:SAM-dependent methyltransferase
VESASETAPDTPRYDAGRPTDIHAATPAHRYREHIRRLRPFLKRLASDLRAGDHSRILDFGAAESPYRDFFPPGSTYLAADLPGNPHADLTIAADGTVPADDGAFDAILSTQVLEHVPDPAGYLAEAHRLLKPGGRILVSTHGVFIYHPDPEDLWRWTAAGLTRQLEAAGFRVLRTEGMLGLLPTGLQLVQDSIYWHLPRLLRAPFAFVMQGLIALGDRLHGDESRRYNAQVYGAVAEKP